MIGFLQGVSKKIEDNLVLLVILAIILGVTFGWAAPTAAKGVKSLSTVALFIMLYPMMIGLRIEEVGKAVKNIKLISASMIINFVLSPLVAALLAFVFLHSRPDFAVGLILTGSVPCAGMVAGWTGYAKGNVALALVLVAASLLIAIVTVPISMSLLAGIYVDIDALALFKDILLTVGVPLVVGNLTRRAIVHWWGNEGFQKVKPILPGASMLGMYLIVFNSMALEANNVVHHPLYFLIVGVPLAIFYLLMFSAAVGLSRWLNFGYKDMVAFSYGVAGKNISIALAIATTFFSPLTVLVLALKPIIQIGFMTLFLRLTARLQKWFAW